jgi:two-component system OmpR family response regulator
LYDNNSERDLSSINYINRGLEEKQLCIYASVNAYDDTSHLEKICSQIKDYKENINKRNLLIVDLKPFYDSALKGDLTPFEDLYIQLLQQLKNRHGKCGVLIVADCADSLFRNKHFDQCNLVEKWWQDVYVKWIRQQHQEREQGYIINVICPHSGSLLSKHPFDQHKHQLCHNHSITVDASGRMLLTEHATRFYEEKIQNAAKSSSSLFPTIEKLPKRVLVAEPEPDIQQIYSIWLNSMGFEEVVITDSGKKCLDEILKIADITKNENNTKVFDLIILDTHIKDIPCIQVAKEIFSRKPDQRIIFTTTMPSNIVRQDIHSIGIKNNDNNNEILTKPFRLSDLSSLIGRSINNDNDVHLIKSTKKN